MSALLEHENIQANRDSVTNISPSARVDYILRFSKQAVYVVDELAEHYAPVSSQFLSQLDNTRNAAYLTVARKLNDIQIRCRLFEQLFSNQLFDPEQSLAVTIVNAVKQEPQSISIVVEDCQHLSLQLLHELCQLAEIANRANLDIQVLMVGSPDAGQVMASNKMLFDKKVAIVAAQSAQLVPLTSPMFNHNYGFKLSKTAQRYTLGFILLVAIAVGVVWFLYQQDSLSFSGLTADSPVPATEPLKLVTDNESGLESAVTHLPADIANTLSESPEAIESAAPQEILNAIIFGELEPEVIAPASNQDIIDALASTVTTDDTETSQLEVILEPQPVSGVSENTDKPAKPISGFEQAIAPYLQVLVTSVYQPDYYLRDDNGVVIQFGAFVVQDAAVFQQFTRQYPELSHYGYLRTLNQKLMFVITSGRFADRASASAAMAELPDSLKDKGLWIKSVRAIQNEINQTTQGF